MASSRASTVEQYLAELPADRRKVIATLRAAINRNLPAGYVEGMSYGMIGWYVPLSRYPDTYNGQPLMYLALAAQKNNYALYSMCVYANPGRLEWVREEFRRAGLRLDMGKSCIRFRSLEAIPIHVVEGLAASLAVERFLEIHERARAGAARGRHGAGSASRKPAKRSAPASRKPAKRSAPASRKPAASRPAKPSRRG